MVSCFVLFSVVAVLFWVFLDGSLMLCSPFQPPQSFLATMEDYIREAPRMVSVPNEPLVSTYSF